MRLRDLREHKSHLPWVLKTDGKFLPSAGYVNAQTGNNGKDYGKGMLPGLFTKFKAWKGGFLDLCLVSQHVLCKLEHVKENMAQKLTNVEVKISPDSVFIVDGYLQ